MDYLIRINKLGSSFKMNYPLLFFEDKYQMLHELNRCDAEYILDEVMPNIELIRKGEKVPDVSIKHHTINLIDTYEFGFDATMIDFGKEKSVISYGFWEGEIEVASDEIYQFMKEWSDCLRKWKEEKEKL